jgi:SnoaL-like domain
MSDASMEAIAARIQTALGAADLSGFADLLHPDVRWGPPDDPNPGCTNRKQVLTWYRRGFNAGVRAEVVECQAFDCRILIGTRIWGSDEHFAAEGVERWQVFTVNGGQIVEITGFDDRSEALARSGG